MEKTTRNLLILAGAIVAATVGVLIWTKAPDKTGTGGGTAGDGGTDTGAGLALPDSTTAQTGDTAPTVQTSQTAAPVQTTTTAAPQAATPPVQSTVYVNDFNLLGNKDKSTITANAKISAAALYRIKHFQAGAQDLAELPNLMSVAVAMESWWHYWWVEGRTNIDHSPFYSNWIRQHATMPAGFIWGRSAGENALLAYAYFDKYGKSWILTENPPASKLIEAPTPM